MAAPTSTIVLTTSFASINGVDLSAYVKSLTIEITPDALPDEAMGQTYHTKKPGVLSFKATVEFYQRYDASLVNETIFPLVTGGTLFAAIFKGVTASATNNTFTLANAIVEGGLNPLAGAFGTLAMATLQLGPGFGFTIAKT